MKKNIVVATLSLTFLIGCLSNSLTHPVNTYPSEMYISEFRTSAFQTDYAEEMITTTSTATETLALQSTLTPTPTVTPVLVHSNVLGENCSTTNWRNINENEVDYDLNATLLNMIPQLPPNIIIPPQGIDFDGGIYMGDGRGNDCYFISIPKNRGYEEGYTYWNGKGNIIYWTKGIVKEGGPSKYNIASGGWYWIIYITQTKEMEIQLLTPEYLRPTPTPTFDYPVYQTAVNQTLSVYMTHTKTSTPIPPITP